MSDLTRFNIAYLFEGFHLWFGVAVFYYVERGLSIEQTMSMIALFSLSMVVFEYPTGVIADTYGHRTSLVAGLSLSALAFLCTSLPLSYGIYVAIIILGAFGSALASGSNIALLHRLSSDFRKDYAHIRSIRLILSAAGITIGGFLYQIHIALPYFLTAVAVAIAAMFYAYIPDVQIDKSRNAFFTTLKLSTSYVWRHRAIKAILLSGGVFLMIRISYKWVGPTVFSFYEIGPTVFATALSVGTLMMGVCTKWAGTRYAPPLSFVIIAVCASVAMFAFGSTVEMLVCGLVISHALQGNIDVALKHAINHYATDQVRASVNSLESLLARIFVVGYIPLMGSFLGLSATAHYHGIFTLICIVVVSVMAYVIAPRLYGRA